MLDGSSCVVLLGVHRARRTIAMEHRWIIDGPGLQQPTSKARHGSCA